MEDEAFTKKKQQMEQLGLFYDEHTGKFFKKDAIIRQRQHESSISHPPPSIQSRLANKKSKLESPFPCTFQHALFQLQTGYSKTELNFKKTPQATTGGSASSHLSSHAQLTRIFSTRKFVEQTTLSLSDTPAPHFNTLYFPAENQFLVASCSGELVRGDWLEEETIDVTDRLHIPGILSSLSAPQMSPSIYSLTTLGDWGSSGALKIFSRNNHQLIYSKQFIRTSLWNHSWNNEGTKIALGKNKKGFIFDVPSEKNCGFIDSLKSDVFSTAFDPSSSSIVLSGARDGAIRQTDLRANKTIKINQTNKFNSVRKVHFLQTDSNYYCFASTQSIFSLADKRKSHNKLAECEIPSALDHKLDFEFDTEENILFCSSQRSILLFDFRRGKLLNSLSFDNTISSFLVRSSFGSLCTLAVPQTNGKLILCSQREK